LETPCCIIFCTASSEAEGERIAAALVEKKLAACCNIIPDIKSVYRWKGQVESAEEVLLVIKSTSELFSQIKKYIIDLHSYDVPEILAIPVVDGSEEYMEWIRTSTSG